MFACSESPGPERAVAPEEATRNVANATGLVAAYGFNEASGTTVSDASPGNNPGTFGSGVSRTTAGKFGGALSFSGSGFVAIPNSASLSITSALTLEAWVNPTAVNSNWRDVIDKGNDNYYLMATSTQSPRPVGAITRKGDAGTTKAFGTATLAANKWTHLAMTYDGSTVRLYVNGSLVSSTAAAGSITSSTGPLQIGGDAVYAQFFQGLIDEVRVYNRALSSAEIQGDMNTPVSSAPPADTTAPSISIASPTSSATYTTTANTLSLSGTASDNVGVTDVEWSNSNGGSGTATGTTSWSVSGIPLHMGSNVVTVSARDAANNVGVDTLTVTVNAPTSGAVGLVAAFAFNETSGSGILDASVNKNGGTMGSGVTRTSSGRFGGGLAFNGGMVMVPHTASLGLTTGMTLEAWVNPTSVTSDWADILNKGQDNYYLMASSTKGPQPVGAVTLVGDGHSTNLFSSTTLPANTWTHLASTYDGTTLRLFVNGVEIANVPGGDAIATSTDALSIGGDPYFGQFFRGTIDEVRIYSRALTAAEIATDMTTAIAGGAPPSTDATAPTVSISSPSSSGSFTTTTSTVNLSGAANDNVGVAQVTWSNSRGGSGTASGTTSWSANGIVLQSGSNVVTVTARDAASNSAAATITVTYNAPSTPTPVAAAVGVLTQPSSSAASGVALAQQPVVQLRDASGVAVAQSGIVVTAAIATGGGSLGGTATATTNASGIATFTNLSITVTAAGAQTLRFSAPSLTAATSSSINVAAPSPPSGSAPPGATEPVYDASKNTMIYQDNMDQYTSAAAMGAAGQTGPRITPNPSPLTTSSSVSTSQNQLITGRDGTGHALRLGFSGANQTSATFITWNMPSTPTLATHYFQYYGRVNFSSPFGGTMAVKWFEAWHVHTDRVQWNTHDHLPCPTSTGHGTYWQVYDQSRETTCQGNQPLGPYFNTVADNQWHRFTYQYRPNSATGARDGVARMWIDGVKIIDISAATIGVTPSGGDKPWCLADDVDKLAVADGMFNQFWGSTQTTDTPSWTYDIDDYKWWITP